MNSNGASRLKYILLVSGGSVLISFLMVLSNLVIGRHWGTGPESDAYFMSTIVVELIGKGLLFSQVGSVFLRIYLEAERDGTESLRQLVSSVLSTSFLALSSMALVCSVFSESVLSLFAPFFDHRRTELSAQIFSVSVWSLPMEGINLCFLASALRARNDFFLPILSNVLVQILFLMSFFILLERYGIMSLAYARLGSSILGSGVLLIAVKRNIGPIGVRVSFAHPSVRRLLFLMAPFVTMGIVSFINGIAYRVIASTLAVGVFAAVSFAQRLFSGVHNLVTMGVDVVALREFSYQLVYSQKAEMGRTVRELVRSCFVFVLPIVVFTASIANPLMSLMLNEHALIDVSASALRGFMMVSFLSVLSQIVFYNPAVASGETKFLNSLMMLRYAIWTIIMIVSVPYLTFWALILPQVVLGILDLTVFRSMVERKLGLVFVWKEFPWRSTGWLTVVILVLGALTITGEMFLVIESISVVVAFIIISAIFWLLGFLFTIHVLKIEEVFVILTHVRRKLRIA